jgi:type I restriction enzyme S subunit
MKEWKESQFGSICKITGGYAFKSSDFIDDSRGIPVIKIGEIQDRVVKISAKTSYVPVQFLQKQALDKYLLKNEDTLIALTGATTGKIGTYRGISGNAYLNQRVGKLNALSELSDSAFIRYLAQTDEFQRKIKGDILASAQGNISPSKIEAIKVIVPTCVDEQRKIAYILSTIQDAIEKQESVINTTTELKKALMQKLFTVGLNGEPQKETEIGFVPESWAVKHLGDNDVLDQMQYGTSIKCEYELDGLPVLRIPNVSNGKIDISDLKFGKPKNNEIGNLQLKKGDLLFVRTNGVKENAGRCAVFNDELENCYYASYLIKVHFKKLLNPDFISLYAETPTGTSFLSGRSVRTADGKFNINTGILKSCPIPVPGIEEQNGIVGILKKVEQKIDLAFNRSMKLKELFSVLLHQLMTAQIRVNDIDFDNLDLVS